MTDHIAMTLATWASSIGSLEPHLAQDVRRRMLDCIGIMVAASVSSAEGTAARSVATELGGPGGASVIGGRDRLVPSSAALANGTLAHSLDYDDTHLPSVLHPSASVIPAVLAVAEGLETIDENLLLTSIACGIEITNRLGMGSYDRELGNSVLFEHGFHATSICGAIGAAAATSLLVGLSTDEIAHAMAVAASMGSGIIEANRTGGTVKKTHCGWAAHAGIGAMMFARAGITGAPTAFEGRFGFFQAYAGGFLDRDSVTGDLGTRWELLRTHFKPYPSNHFTHGAIDAALDLKARGLEVDGIQSISLGVAAPTLRTIAEPPDLKARPPTPYAAQFSGPFVLARALLFGGGLGVYLDDFTDETIEDERTLELAALVQCHEDPAATARFPNAFPAVVTVTDAHGSEWVSRIDTNRGGPERPLSNDELHAKFRLNATRSLSEAQADELAAVIFGIGTGTAPQLFDILGSCHA